jgi:type I restriction enzyme R subunit
VFFKPVRPKTKFWQMIGRGTRLCPDLFGPGRHKEFFYLFDWCRNFEFFNQHPDVTDGASADTLAKRLFTTRVELVSQVDSPQGHHVGEPGSKPERIVEIKKLRDDLAAALRTEISGMSLDNFLVRPHRRYVEKYGSGDAWVKVDADAQHEAKHGCNRGP